MLGAGRMPGQTGMTTRGNLTSAKLDVAIAEAIAEAIQRHAATYRQRVSDLEETLFALCRVSSAQLNNITDPDERAAMLCVLVEELQRAAQGQSSERDHGQPRAEGVCHSPSVVDIAEGSEPLRGGSLPGERDGT